VEALPCINEAAVAFGIKCNIPLFFKVPVLGW
jgi:hypothetical protein